MDRRKRLIIFAVILFAVMLGVGISAVQSSGYRDVCSVYSLKAPAELVLSGNISYYPPAPGYIVEIDGPGGSALLVSTPQSSSAYLVARVVKNSLEELSGDSRYAVFVLRGSCGRVAVALYSASEFIQKYGGNPVVSDVVVIDAVYRPGLTAKIFTRDGRLVYTGPVLLVNKILKGCHESYQETAATVG